jgi:hypothetical protein
VFVLSLGEQLDKIYVLTSRVLQLLFEEIRINPKNRFIKESFNRIIGELLDNMVGAPIETNINFYRFFTV